LQNSKASPFIFLFLSLHSSVVSVSRENWGEKSARLFSERQRDQRGFVYYSVHFCFLLFLLFCPLIR